MDLRHKASALALPSMRRGARSRRRHVRATAALTSRPTKPECESAIRSLASQWFHALPDPTPEHPSWSTFKTWLRANGYSHYLEFRSVRGPDADGELWFNQELGQSWRC